MSVTEINDPSPVTWDDPSVRPLLTPRVRARAHAEGSGKHLPVSKPKPPFLPVQGRLAADYMTWAAVGHTIGISWNTLARAPASAMPRPRVQEEEKLRRSELSARSRVPILENGSGSAPA